MANEAEDAARAEFEAIVTLTAQAARGAAVDIRILIANLLRQGMAPEDVKKFLIADLRRGGRVFGPLKASIRASVAERVGGAMDNVQRAVYDARLEARARAFDAGLAGAAEDAVDDLGGLRDMFETGDEALETWITVNRTAQKTTKPCPDCYVLHQVTMKRKEWNQRGRPRWGTTICASNCYCRLVPTAAAVKDGSLRPELERPVEVPRVA